MPGFYIAAIPRVQITPQFYPLHPVKAVAARVARSGREFVSDVVVGLLGVLAVFFAVRRGVWARAVGGLDSELLAITATQIWFARFVPGEGRDGGLADRRVAACPRSHRAREGY